VALALVERSEGADHPDTAKARANVGDSLRELGRLDEAEVELQRAYEIRKRVLPPTHQDIAASLHQLCQLRLAQHRVRDAIALCEQSRDTFVRGLGATSVMVTYATSPLGRAQLAAGDAKAARATLAATIASLERSKIDPVMLATTRLALADAEWQLGNDDAAIAAAARAPADLAPMPAGSNAKLRGEMASWRDRHRR
jgi:tetratricopeptide (TPR) repeat protein